jgi:hypothetical protein
LTSNVDLTNRALAQIGTRSQITSMVDGSSEALYANLMYNGLRDFMLVEGDYDFSQHGIPLVDAGLGTLVPWGLAYQYPTAALRIRQVYPVVFDLLDPKPVAWSTMSIGGVRYLTSKTPLGIAICTYAVVEDDWDAIFTEAFIRLLASALSFSLENRIEASKEKLTEALSFANIANMRDP